jgi:hypothetical protein
MRLHNEREKMRILLKIFLLLAISLAWSHALALPGNVTATADVTCTVDNIMEWEGNFTALNLDHIIAQDTVVATFDTVTLYTNGDVHITADNSAFAELRNFTGGSLDVLVTEYRLVYDADGGTTGTEVPYTEYDEFLVTPSVVTHVSLDGAVEVALYVQASNRAGDVADAGDYAATQTLTASWGTGA